MLTDTESGWSFPVENGHLAPRSIAGLIEAVAGHHVNERQIAQWAIHHGEVSTLPPVQGSSLVRYAISPVQGVATLNALGRQYGMDTKLRFASIADLEVECHHGHVLLVEIDDAESDPPTRFAELTDLDLPGDAVCVTAPEASGRGTATISLSALERAWSASNGAMIVTSRGAEPGPVLLPVVIESRLLSAA